MTKDFIEGAQGTLMLVNMKLAKGDVEKATKQMHNVMSFLAQANQSQLANEANKIIEFLQKNNVGDARKVLIDLQAKVNKLLDEEQEEIKHEKPHIHLVKEFECPSCHKRTPEKGNFCTFCGHRLITEKCPGCHHPFKEGQKFCTNCGRKLL